MSARLRPHHWTGPISVWMNATTITWLSVWCRLCKKSVLQFGWTSHRNTDLCAAPACIESFDSFRALMNSIYTSFITLITKEHPEVDAEHTEGFTAGRARHFSKTANCQKHDCSVCASLVSWWWLNILFLKWAKQQHFHFSVEKNVKIIKAFFH